MKKVQQTGIETLKERVRVKFKDKEGYFYKKFDAKDLKIIKDVEDKDDLQGVNSEDLKELRKLEKLEEQDKMNQDDIQLNRNNNIKRRRRKWHIKLQINVLVVELVQQTAQLNVYHKVMKDM